MGKIYVIIGKSASGKDTIAKRLLNDRTLGLHPVVPYTTRPIRAGEIDGTDYNFTDQKGYDAMLSMNRVIESRTYHTVYGDWHYFTADDGQIDLSAGDSLCVGTLESFRSFRRYYGDSAVMPIYIEVDDGVRLKRALDREMQQESPKYSEMCRRFLADQEDFSEEKLRAAGIERRFENRDIDHTVEEIAEYIRGEQNGHQSQSTESDQH